MTRKAGKACSARAQCGDATGIFGARHAPKTFDEELPAVDRQAVNRYARQSIANERSSASGEAPIVQVLTFDFHNTLANCDRWFELEIRDLPWAVIEQLDLPTVHTETEVAAIYRRLRLSVIESGNEIDATTSVVQVFGELGINGDVDAVESAINALMLRAIDGMEPVPGAIDAVRSLHSAGTRLGVISSAVHHMTLEWILDRMAIRECFDHIVTSASSGYYKSTPAIYTSALAQLGGTAAFSVHVGDSLRWDVQTAQSAGLTAVWLQTQRREVFPNTPAEVSPALTLPSLHGAAPPLLDLLRSLDPA
jgi:HAD superfamily hydrolase (TIGR01549 family)